MRRPFLAITPGDPAGCGPRAAFQAALDPRVRRVCRPVVVGDAWAVDRFGSTPSAVTISLSSLDDYREDKKGVCVLNVPHPDVRSVIVGAPSRAGGESATLWIRSAVALAMSKRVTAVVTGPVSKESFQFAGMPHSGHTELLAALSGAKNVEMIMMAGRLRTLLVTRHIPLKDVSSRLTKPLIVDSVVRADRWARECLGLKRPGWVVCGINPHAGDRGVLGGEEIRVVAPAVKDLRRKGIDVEGPWPADSAWSKHAAGRFDLVASLYHDQGMIPLKTLNPRFLINVTAGLPFVRTSPGHGTAFDLGVGRSPYRSLDVEPTVQACLAAVKMSCQ